MRDPWFPVVCIFIIAVVTWLGIVGPLPNTFAVVLEKWQTLIAAFVALIAAYIAFQNTSRTLRNSRRLEKKRRSRKHAAVRAVLPLALSQIVEYAQHSAISLDKAVSAPGQISFSELPRQLPRDTLGTLAEFIEYSPKQNASLVEYLVAWIQIHNSRVRSLVIGQTMSTRHNVVSGIVDAAAIFAAANALFDYARRCANQPPRNLTWVHVRDAVFLIGGLSHATQDAIDEFISQKEKSSKGPFYGLAP